MLASARGQEQEQVPARLVQLLARLVQLLARLVQLLASRALKA